MHLKKLWPSKASPKEGGLEGAFRVFKSLPYWGRFGGGLLIFIAFQTNAATVDTVNIFSVSMHKSSRCVVVKPKSYNADDSHYPVVYLLHGFAGDYSNWIKKVPEIKNYSDEFGLIIVCPDGAFASWYFDSPVDPSMKYETYISQEVPHYIDSAYKTIPDRFHRAITGLSMGGHGALFIAWRHSTFFGAAGSMTGGVDLKESTNKFQIEKVLGDTIKHADNWKNYSMINIAENKPPDSLGIIVDDGFDDIFIKGNRHFHQILLASKIAHEYIERPGKHSWDYWRYAVQFQLLYFRKYFDFFTSHN